MIIHVQCYPVFSKFRNQSPPHYFVSAYMNSHARALVKLLCVWVKFYLSAMRTNCFLVPTLYPTLKLKPGSMKNRRKARFFILTATWLCRSFIIQKPRFNFASCNNLFGRIHTNDLLDVCCEMAGFLICHLLGINERMQTAEGWILKRIKN